MMEKVEFYLNENQEKVKICDSILKFKAENFEK